MTPRFPAPLSAWPAAVLTLALVVLMTVPPRVVAADDPRAIVAETVDAVLAVLADDTLPEDAKAERVKALIAARLDEQGIARRVLATNWHGATLSERRRFTDRFVALVVENYWRKIRKYSDEQVEIGDAEEIDTRRIATVPTVIRTASADVPVDYKLTRSPKGAWRVYDVVIERISLVRNYRASFQEMVQRDGLEHVITELERKLDELALDPT